MHRVMGRKRKLVTGWRLFFIIVITITILWFVEDRFVRVPATKAFYPPNTYCMISSWDFPKAWAAFHRSDVLARMKEDWPRPYAELELAARLGTGIRPTPNRWILWLGRRTVFAFAPEGVGITAYPGHVLRWADGLRGAIGYGPDADGIATYRGYSYAWRDEYLIASTSRAYVEAALADGDAPLLHSDNEVLLTFQWEGEHRGFINLEDGAGLPVSGQFEFAAKDGQRPITLSQAWPSTPAVSLTARSADDVATILSAIDGLLAKSAVYAQLRVTATGIGGTWGLDKPGSGWAAGADHFSVALLDIDAQAALPVPDLALVVRYAESAPETNPFGQMLAERQTIPFEWNDNSGIMVPLLGTEWSPCIARTPHEWIVASREPVMANIAGNLAVGPACAVDVDVALRASWEKLGAIAKTVAVRLGKDEVLPRMNSDDVQETLVPKLAALSKLGAIAIDGVARGGTLKFSGHLAKRVENGTP